MRFFVRWIISILLIYCISMTTGVTRVSLTNANLNKKELQWEEIPLDLNLTPPVFSMTSSVPIGVPANSLYVAINKGKTASDIDPVVCIYGLPFTGADTIDNLPISIKDNNILSMKAIFLEKENADCLFIGTENNNVLGVILGENPKPLLFNNSLFENNNNPVRSIKYSKDTHRVIASFDNMGIYYFSTDNLDVNQRITWTPIGNLLDNWPVGFQNMKPTHFYDILMTNENIFWALTDQGIYQLKDNKWSLFNILTANNLQAIGYKILQIDETIWLVTNHGVFKSSISGTDWVQMIGIDKESFALISDTDANYPFITNYQEYLWITSSTQVFLSKDNGLNWISVLFDPSVMPQGVTIKGLETLYNDENSFLTIIGLSNGKLLKSMVNNSSIEVNVPPKFLSMNIDDKPIKLYRLQSDVDETIWLNHLKPKINGQIEKGNSDISSINLYISYLNNSGCPAKIQLDHTSDGSFSEQIEFLNKQVKDFSIEVVDKNDLRDTVFFSLQIDDIPPKIDDITQLETKTNIKFQFTAIDLESGISRITISHIFGSSKNENILPQENIEINGDEYTFEVKPEPGENKIIITASDIANNVITEDKIFSIKEKAKEIILVLKINDKYATKNGETIELDVPPEIQKGRTFVPVRFIAEAFGAEVNWVESIQQIVVSLDKNGIKLRIMFWIGLINYFIESGPFITEKQLEAAPYIHKASGRAMIPFRVISEAFGAKVEWDAMQRKITILYTPEEPKGP